jgi:hypothetical protein
MKLLLTSLVLILEVGLALLPWLPGVSSIIPAEPSPKVALDTTIAVVGAHVAILVAYVAAMFAADANEQGKEHDALRDDHKQIIAGVERGEVRQLRDDQFYADFLKHAQKAQSYVYISYFSTLSPDQSQSHSIRDYYDEILKTIKKTGSVRFRRLVRDTESNRAWLRKLIPQLDGRHNADLGLVGNMGSEVMPIALSVQVVDGKYSWLVATRAHDRIGEYRDVFIDDEIIGGELCVYHQRLWSQCAKLLESGIVTDTGKQLLMEKNDASSSK